MPSSATQTHLPPCQPTTPATISPACLSRAVSYRLHPLYGQSYRPVPPISRPCACPTAAPTRSSRWSGAQARTQLCWPRWGRRLTCGLCATMARSMSSWRKNCRLSKTLFSVLLQPRQHLEENCELAAHAQLVLKARGSTQKAEDVNAKSTHRIQSNEQRLQLRLRRLPRCPPTQMQQKSVAGSLRQSAAHAVAAGRRRMSQVYTHDQEKTTAVHTTALHSPWPRPCIVLLLWRCSHTHTLAINLTCHAREQSHRNSRSGRAHLAVRVQVVRVQMQSCGSECLTLNNFNTSSGSSPPRHFINHYAPPQPKP